MHRLLDLIFTREVREIFVCHLDQKITELVGVSHTEVKLTKHRLNHIIDGHVDVKAKDLMFLPDAITRGLIIQEHLNPPSINICYQHPVIEKRRYKVNIRCIGGELLIMSFHKTRKRQTRSLLKRGKILRRHL